MNAAAFAPYLRLWDLQPDGAPFETPSSFLQPVTRSHAPAMLAELYAARLSLDVQRILGFAFAHAGLAASWSLEDGRDPAYRLRCAEILEPLVSAPSA